MKLTCADPACERPRVRQRDGQWWCTWHPTQQAPSIDMLSGALRDPKDPRKHAPRVITVKAPRTAPVPVQKTPKAPAQPRAPRPPRTARTATPKLPITLGPCPTTGCRRLWPHGGRHALKQVALPAPRPLATVDHTDAAQRYQAGARLYDLSAQLGIGVKRLRAILTEQGIPIRSRGEAIDHTSRNPGKPLDTAALELLYAAGTNTTDIARHLGVKNQRVTQHLRERGLLRPPANNRHQGYTDLRIHLEPGVYQQIQQHMTTRGHQYVTHYIKELIINDLASHQADSDVA